MTHPPLDSDWVRTYSNRYVERMSDVEPALFAVVGPTVARRGHYEPDELAAVARWKTPRSQSRIASNTVDDVVDISSTALAAPERVQHRVLTLLAGVGVPTATALLAIVLPERHTVLDVRSTEALRRVGEWDGLGGYEVYLQVCRRLAGRLDVDLRTLDRALWRWSKDGYP